PAQHCTCLDRCDCRSPPCRRVRCSSTEVTWQGELLRASQRLLQVGNQIIGGFDAYGQPQQVFRYRAGWPFNRVAVFDQAFDAAEWRRSYKGFQAAGHRQRSLLSSLDAQRQHAAEPPGHLAPGDLVARMTREPGIQYALDLRMVFEVPGYLQGRGTCFPDTEKQGAHSPLQQPCFE